MYVWVDALTNYLTGVGFPDETSPRWRYWPADVHVIGKDIVRFHAVYWPAFLMSAGLPAAEARVRPRLRAQQGREDVEVGRQRRRSVRSRATPTGVDPVRYFFLREVTFGQDGNYSPEAIANRINADLANDLGNLAQRSLSMIAKNCDGTIPEPGEFTDADKADPGGGGCALREGARGHGSTGASRKYLDAVWARGRGCQPLLRGRGAVGEEEDRSSRAWRRSSM